MIGKPPPVWHSSLHGNEYIFNATLIWRKSNYNIKKSYQLEHQEQEEYKPIRLPEARGQKEKERPRLTKPSQRATSERKKTEED